MWNFSQYTDAELASVRAAALAQLLVLLGGPKSGSQDGAAFSEMSLAELKEVQGAIDAEERQRAEVPGGFLAAEFEDPS